MASPSTPTPGVKLPTISILGSLNADLVTYTPRLPLGGETLHATSFHTGAGGKGANQAAACGRLSRANPSSSTSAPQPTAEIRMLGAVGNDSNGTMLLESLTASGVDVSGVVKTKDATTGVAVIIVEETSGENRILLSAGANFALRPEGFQTVASLCSSSSSSLSPDNSRTQIHKPDLVILQLEIPLETTVQIMQTAREAEVPVLLNPAPAVEGVPVEVYKGLAHLIMNETEAAILSGLDEEELNTAAGLEKAVDLFHDRGVVNVVITLGGRGVFCSGPGIAGKGEGHHQSVHVPAQKVKVVDTTAAGDTFVGAYALEVVKVGGKGDGRGGFDLENAVRVANRAAARTIQKRGAQESIPWGDEV